MHQFEYKDINRFFVSIGIFLIVLTFFLPWLFFRENFNLLITTDELEKLTKTAQNIILQRQTYISYFPRIIFFISILSFFAGVIFIRIGIKGWIKNEKLIKESNQLTENLDYNSHSSSRKIISNPTPIQKIKCASTRLTLKSTNSIKFVLPIKSTRSIIRRYVFLKSKKGKNLFFEDYNSSKPYSMLYNPVLPIRNVLDETIILGFE